MSKRKHREDFHDDFSYECYIDELFEGSYKNGYDKGRQEGEEKGRLKGEESGYDLGRRDAAILKEKIVKKGEIEI